MLRVMMGLSLVCIPQGQALCENVFYDAYNGTKLTPEKLEEYKKLNLTFWCTNKVELPCDPNEGRRFDGSCNNLINPSRGTSHTPPARLLSAAYNSDFGPRKAKSGDELPEPRRLRTTLISEGVIPDQIFTHLVTYFLIFFWGDNESIHDTINYILWKPYCCEEKGKDDPFCARINIPDDDPVHRFTNIRCMNLTKPLTYQNMGCVSNKTTPSRLVSTTPFIDLNHVYGSGEGLKNARLFKNGMLKYEILNGRVWPPSMKTGAQSVCLENHLPHETRCHAAPENGMNAILGVNLVFIWVWRYHNKIASELAKINPCWSDEKIFLKARDINIAMITQIMYYDLFSHLMGRDNLVQDGVLSNDTGFRDIYDDTEVPKTSIEFPLVGRWVHTIQPGKVRLYDSSGCYLREYPEVNLTLRTGWIAIDNHLEYLTHGAYRQPISKIGRTVDPLIVQTSLGPLQKAHDVLAYDLTKNRYFGIAPYIKYRNLCSDCHHTSFDDLSDVFDPEYLEMLQNAYTSVEDIDLLTGIWLEKWVKNGHVPVTFYCIVARQLLKSIKFDRHWYERPNRPDAFTYPQLLEIRKATAARLLCDVGDNISKIQPLAFLRVRDGNQPRSCGQLPKIRWEAWKDCSCQTE